MPRLRLSLAQKCQLLFGAAVVIILGAALTVPWMRMQKLVEEGQRETARQLADAWLNDLIKLGDAWQWAPEQMLDDGTEPALQLTLIDQDIMDVHAAADPFIARAREQFEIWSNKVDDFQAVPDAQGRRLYRYARAIRQRDLEGSRGGFGSNLPPTQVANPMRMILLVEMRAEWADQQLRLNQIYLATAGLLAGLLAIAVFWFITTRIVLSPVRVLRETAEKVAEGDLQIRSDINTGDEFEQLSDTFNTMLTNLRQSQDKLRDLNKQLDMKVGELAESNVSLYEANRLKTDFLANVSHELRTPLNSIIGFAEVLGESVASDNGARDEKRRRYIENILTSSRSLLQMIEELLDLAKIEAGRVDLHVERLSVRDTCESLLNLIRPQADRKQIQLDLAVSTDVPIVSTDAGKLQQIIFNFLSNAVKFTPRGGRVTLGADPLVSRPGGEPAAVRIWVRDTGPGIAVELHEKVFDKFRQLDPAHTKEHGGAGLGLAISSELARLLEGRIELESDVGRGATFSLVIPLTIDTHSRTLTPDLAT